MDDRFARAYVYGIGGIGSSGPAILLRQMGYRVAGSDLRSSELTQALEKLGIDVRIESGEKSVVLSRDIRSDIERSTCVIVPAALPPDHPVYEIARACGIPVLSRTQALADIARLPQMEETPIVLCMGTLSRARCARTLAALAGSRAGFCCGAAVRTAAGSPTECADRAETSLHARIGSPFFCDIDERDIFLDPALLDAFQPRTVAVTDFARPDFGYYAADQDLPKLVGIASLALERTSARACGDRPSDAPNFPPRSLIFPDISHTFGDKIRFIQRIFGENSSGIREENADFPFPDRREESASLKTSANPIEPARSCRDMTFDFEFHAKDGRFCLSPFYGHRKKSNSVPSLPTPVAVSGTRADVASVAAARLAALHLGLTVDHLDADASNGEQSSKTSSSPTVGNDAAAESHSTGVGADKRRSDSPPASDRGRNSTLPAKPFKARNAIGDIAFVGWFERVESARAPLGNVYYDIRMHPVSVAESLASIHELHPESSTIIVFRPFISTLKYYTAETWAVVLRRAHAVFIATPPYEGCNRGDSERFSRDLCRLGLDAQCFEISNALPRFDGAILIVGAPDMRALFDS